MLYERRERESQGMLLSYCTLPFLSPQICSWCRDCQSGTSHFVLSLCLLPGNFNFGTFCEVYTPCLFPLNYLQGWKHSVIAKALGLKPCLAIAVGRALRNLSTDGSSPPSGLVDKGGGEGVRGLVGAALCGARLSIILLVRNRLQYTHC